MKRPPIKELTSASSDDEKIAALRNTADRANSDLTKLICSDVEGRPYEVAIVARESYVPQLTAFLELLEHDEDLLRPEPDAGEPRCRLCDCSEREPCEPPCAWCVLGGEEDCSLCSACHEIVGTVLTWLELSVRPSLPRLIAEVARIRKAKAA